MEASNLNKKNRNTTTITDTKTSASNTDIQHYLHHMILQTKECLMDDRFELTRMADQVLPGLVKLLCWIDVNILGKHWLSLGNSMRDKDALTCRFISSSLLVAIKYFTDNYHINENINNYHLLIQSCLNINKLFFEKNKLSKNNSITKQIKQFNENVNIINNEVQLKENKSKVSLDKKKLMELKKIADTKMKLKINKVEEIDSLILNKKL